MKLVLSQLSTSECAFENHILKVKLHTLYESSSHINQALCVG